MLRVLIEQVDNVQEQMSNKLDQRLSSCSSQSEMKAGLPAVCRLGQRTDRLPLPALLSGTPSRITKPAELWPCCCRVSYGPT